MNVYLLSGLALSESYRQQRDTLDDAWAIINSVLSPKNDHDLLHDVELQSFLIPELTTIISRIDAFDYDPDDLEFVPLALRTKAMAFGARFRITGDLEDIDEATSLLKTVAHFPDFDPSLVADETFILANSRYNHTRNANDLDRLIEAENALLRCRNVYPQRGFLKLASHLIIRFKETHDIADAEHLLSLSEEMYPFLTIDSEDLPTWSLIRGFSITCLSKMGRKFSDIRQAFDHVEEGYNRFVSTIPSARRVSYIFLAEQLKFAALNGELPQLREIGWIARSHPESTRWGLSFVSIFLDSPEAELDELIALLRAWCNATDPNDECMSMYTIVLAAALFERFKKFGKPEDVQEAIAFREPFASEGAFLVDLMLFGHAAILHPEFEERFKRALITHLGDEGKAWLASKPSNILQFGAKFVETLGQKNELTQFVGSVDLLDSLRPHETHNHDFVQYLLSPVLDRDTMYALDPSHNQADIAEFYRQKAMDLFHERGDSDDCQYGVEMVAAMVLSSYAQLRPLPNHEHCSPSDNLYVVANDRQASIENRRLATIAWFMRLYTSKSFDEQRHRVSEMCDTWLSIMREHNWLSSSTRATLLLQRRDHSDILPLIVITFIFQAQWEPPETNFISRALQILESGRLLLWEQVQSLRATVSTLPDVNYDLFARLKEKSMTLKCHLGLESSSHHGHLGDHIYRSHGERHRIIEEIRLIPGFEDALQDNAKLEIGKCAIPDGHVVTLLAGPVLCLAIIMTTSGCCIKVLPVKSNLLRHLHSALRDFTKSRSAGQCQNVDFSIDDDISSMASTSSHRAGRKRHDPSAQSVESILECLWEKIAKPVLDRIWEITGSVTKGKAKADQKPPLNQRKRIWWCCIGEFSFMPIHAAGIYQGDRCTSVSDYFISSYTPTVGALLSARERPLPNGCKILTVAQPNPGAGMNRLPSVRDELKKILEIVPEDYIIRLGDSEKPDLDGKDTTVENVGSKLHLANILHVACHGVQDIRDPLNSGFILAHGKRLTVEEIMKLDLPNAHTAILSACYTASNDAAIPDESINLASALMYAGFSSILGTQWPMSDDDGPLIAEEVYTTLFKLEEKDKSFLLYSIYRWLYRQDSEWWHRYLQFYNEKNAKTDSDMPAEDDSARSDTRWLHRFVQLFNEGTKADLDMPVDDILKSDSEWWRRVLQLWREDTNTDISAEDKFNVHNSKCGLSFFKEMYEPSGKSLCLLALPEIIDGIARKLRAQGFSASRWATFIHIGV